MNLFKKSLTVEPGLAASLGHLFLRAGGGLMIFYIHGLHKLEGGIAFLHDGTSWKLLEEVSGMHGPAPLATAWVATIIQLVCPLFIAAGLFTRINAALLAGALGGAVLQNVLASRDPQLAILYTLVVVTFVFTGGGKFSLDEKLIPKRDSRS